MKQGLVFLLFMTLCNVGCKSTFHRQKEVSKSSISMRQLEKQINALIDKTDANMNIGIQIISLPDQKIIYEKNSNRHFVPASSLKLITLAGALYYLGPYFRFETALYTDKFTQDHSAINNLYIRGSGDPSLEDADITALVLELVQRGIKHIKGNLYVDDTIFDSLAWGRGVMWDDRSFGYAAPVSGLNMNNNRVTIKVVPHHNVGKTAHAIFQPFSRYVSIFSDIKTGKPQEPTSIVLETEPANKKEPGWPSTSHEGLEQGDLIRLKGSIGHGAGPYYALRAIRDPSLFVGHFLKEQLLKHHIDVSGNVLRLKVPEKTLKLATHDSRPLSEAVIDFLKISNDVATEALVKAIAASLGENPATLQGGIKGLQTFLEQEVGIKRAEFKTADGSGLSRYSLLTPAQMTKVLAYASASFRIGPEFVSAIPIAGYDGTLTRRMSKMPSRGFVRAKTGYMSGISSLAGYIATPEGERLAFTIFINGILGSTAPYMDLQDQIVSSFFKNPEEGIAKAQKSVK